MPSATDFTDPVTSVLYFLLLFATGVVRHFHLGSYRASAPVPERSSDMDDEIATFSWLNSQPHLAHSKSYIAQSREGASDLFFFLRSAEGDGD